MQDCLFTWTESSRYARSRVKDKFNRNDAQAQQRFNYKADRYCQKRLYNRNISGDEQNPVLVTTWPQSEKEIDIGDGKELLRSANGPRTLEIFRACAYVVRSRFTVRHWSQILRRRRLDADHYRENPENSSPSSSDSVTNALGKYPI